MNLFCYYPKAFFFIKKGKGILQSPPTLSVQKRCICCSGVSVVVDSSPVVAPMF